MDNENQEKEIINENQDIKPKESIYSDKYLIPISIVASGLLIAGSIMLKPGTATVKNQKSASAGGAVLTAENQDAHGSSKTKGTGESFVLPVKWGDLGARMVSTGVIDYEKFKQLYGSRGGFTDEEKKNLYLSFGGGIVITE